MLRVVLRVYRWHDAPNMEAPVQMVEYVCGLTPCDLMLHTKSDTSVEGKTTTVINDNKTSRPQKWSSYKIGSAHLWAEGSDSSGKGSGLSRHVLSNSRCHLVLAWGVKRGDWCTQLMCHSGKTQSVFFLFGFQKMAMHHWCAMSRPSINWRKAVPSPGTWESGVQRQCKEPDSTG